jgi:hypothetical protein
MAQRFCDPKKIAQAIASFVYGSFMHSKIVGLEGKKRFGSCKKKLDTMIGSLIDFHHLNNETLQWFRRTLQWNFQNIMYNVGFNQGQATMEHVLGYS